MKSILAPEIERGRIAGESNAGPYGAFSVVHPETGRRLQVVASDGRDWIEEGLPGDAWGHVSVSSTFGTPTWAEMCWIKGMFFESKEDVLQYHPAKSKYVNIHAHCLHLWLPPWPVELPPLECV